MHAKTLITIFAGFFLYSRESLSQVVFPDASGVTAPPVFNTPVFTTPASFFGYDPAPFIQTSKWRNAKSTLLLESDYLNRISLKMFAFAWTAEDVQLQMDFRLLTVLARLTYELFP